jgi:16S rRNA (guanine527-N7)-methyltransferase
MNLEARLAGGIADLGIAIPQETQTRLLQYLALLQKWNQVHNLTAVREPETMLVRHVLESLSILPHVTGPRVADVGSGAGLPGIPLAFARPEWRIVLIESIHKKAVFLQQARIELKLENVEVAAERVENYHPASGFSSVVSRAFSDLPDFIRLAGHLCGAANGGNRLVAMKGLYPHEELTQLPAQFEVEKILPVSVPGLGSKRHLVVIKRAQV